jgi:arginase
VDRILVTPFFIDQAAPAHLRLSTFAAWINQPAVTGATPPERVASIGEPLAAQVHRVIQAGDRPVSIAGDCCSVIALVAGLQRSGISPRLLWLDAHGDFNTPETTPSGFLGGMPLAMLVGRGDQTVMQRLGARPLPEDDVVLCDARDLDPGERQALDGSQVLRLSSIDRLQALELADRPLHVHLDVDIINPLDAPAMAYPTAGGPRLPELEAMAGWLAMTARPVSVSVTTWAFEQDADRRTEQACLRVLRALLMQGPIRR